MLKDMTVGKPERVLWKFSIPMFISVIFQQLYNIADSVIAGKFAGEDALAAVGASYPVTMIFMAVAVGSNIGCSVVISQLFGGKKYRQMKTAISTTMISSILLAVLLSAVGFIGSESLMKLIQTPENIMADGMLYFRIYIAGFLFLFLYNVCTGIFQSLGDSKTPLYFLIGSSIGNIVFDFLFVAVFHQGVAGVAWATFLAQGVACVLSCVTLKKRIAVIATGEKAEIFSAEMLKKISLIAVPSVLQQSFISIGNILIQSLINGYGSSVIAGYSAAVKLNTFTITSFTTLANGVSGFTAQNVGAKKYERVRNGYRAGLKMAMTVAIPFFLCFFFCGQRMVQLFMNSDSHTAVAVGVSFLRIVSPFYFVIAVKLIADGVLRGAGAMRQFMIATFTDLILRVVLAFALSSNMGTEGIWISWPIGWSVAALLSVWFYIRENFKKGQG